MKKKHQNIYKKSRFYCSFHSAIRAIRAKTEIRKDQSENYIQFFQFIIIPNIFLKSISTNDMNFKK